MCTVSFVNNAGSVIITSNRDERISRPDAIEPRVYIVNNTKMIFPKDPLAGGTWMATRENGAILVLMNGAREPHIPKENYRKSRGLILLDIISGDGCTTEWSRINLDNIEPFTLIVFENKELWKLSWNGNDKENELLDHHQSYIWSSSTLYTPEQRAYKERSFNAFMKVEINPDAYKLELFHKNTGGGDELGMVINRNNIVKTFSVTQAVIEGINLSFHHTDLLTNTKYSEAFVIH